MWVSLQAIIQLTPGEDNTLRAGPMPEAREGVECSAGSRAEGLEVGGADQDPQVKGTEFRVGAFELHLFFFF